MRRAVPKEKPSSPEFTTGLCDSHFAGGSCSLGSCPAVLLFNFCPSLAGSEGDAGVLTEITFVHSERCASGRDFWSACALWSDCTPSTRL